MKVWMNFDAYNILIVKFMQTYHNCSKFDPTMLKSWPTPAGVGRVKNYSYAML